MKFLFSILITANCLILLAQGEEVAPLTSDKIRANLNSKPLQSLEKAILSIDSTIIFTSDTLNIPFFDDFCKNKFQKYDVDYSTPGVTSTYFYKILDINDTPLPDKKQFKYSSVPTYRRTYSVDNLTYTDVNFSPISINQTTLYDYPVNYSTVNAYPAYRIIDSLGVAGDVPDTNFISEPDIVQDSANVFFYNLSDPEYLWLDNNTYQNYRFAANPWSLGVATFDGLDNSGKAYYLGSNIVNYGDFLTSKPLNLSTLLPEDSIYLSFLYQSGGFGDSPENGDSLVLEFFDVTLGEWERVWAAKGTSDLDFRVGHLNIKSAKYLKKGFQFRFKNYGHLSGSYDIFNLDYVHLRTDSYLQDTFFIDYAWVYPVKSLLKDYISVPWDHYKNNYNGKMTTAAELVVRNNNNIPSNNNFPANISVKHNNSAEGSFNIAGTSLSNGALNYAPRTTYSSLHDFSTGYHFDETKSGTSQKFDIISSATPLFSSTMPDHILNDTTFTTQYFGNYYAYDDNSAEAAYGPTGTQSNLAVKFIPYEADSLLGIMISFVEAATNVSNKLFLLTVWDDNNGKPGNILYRDNVFSPRQPKYGDNINQFHTYFMSDEENDSIKIKINGPFYIGWQQIDQERLNIGFDKNNINNSKTFYSLNAGATWNQSQIPGTPMIRPLFSTAMDSELGIEENINTTNSSINLQIYPNPTSGMITIKNDAKQNSTIEIYTITGKLIFTSNESEIDLSSYENGVYLFKVKDSQNTIYKVIKY